MKYREECAAMDPPMTPRILFVSHRNEISEQAQERFTRFMPDLDIAFFDTKRKGVPDADLTFATFQSLYSQLGQFDSQDYEYIIYDEAHHSEANTFKAVREHFDPLFELALTATPDRMDEQNIRAYFGEPLYKKTLPEAIAEGWLADVDYHIVFDDIVKQLMEEGFEPKTLKEFHELFKVRPRNEVIAKNIREERHKVGLDTAKTIVFCEDVEHAEEMAGLLGGVAYHSGIKKEDRKPLLKAFRSGKSQIICTVDMFNEGLDVPDARLVVFLRSTSSGTIFEQQLGRGLRKTLGKDKVSVLDFVANVERIQKVRELSKAIQDKSDEGETNEGDLVDGDIVCVDPADDEAASDKGGLRIHGQHGDFDFDRIAVDLLHKLNTLPLGSRKASEGQYTQYGWDSDGCAQYYRNLSERLGYAAKSPDIVVANRNGEGPGQITLLKLFGGTLAQLREAAGIDKSYGLKPHDTSPEETQASARRKRYGDWTETDFINYYRDLSTNLGHPAGIQDMRDASKARKGPHPSVALADFDNSVFTMRERAGYTNSKVKGLQKPMIPRAPKPKEWTPEECATYYKELAEEIGHVPTTDDLKEAYAQGRGPSHTMILKPFDNHMAKLRKAANLKRSWKQDWEEEDFVEYYKSASLVVGHLATAREINAVKGELNGPDAFQIIKLFSGGLTRLKQLYIERYGDE